ncbi:hypothetical protein AGMMS50212_07800 [Spirochaetia bacterium]|nr:hypothetical protein AGMMS50212_07800 [Spirochaetia bacterium]
MEDDLAALGLKDGALYVQKNYSLSLTPEQIINEWRTLALIHYKTTVPIKKPIVDIARHLHKVGCSLAIATSCFPEACEAVLTRYKIQKFFSAVLYTDDFITGKTGADIWLTAAEKLKVDPTECIVFEDSYHSLEGFGKA